MVAFVVSVKHHVRGEYGLEYEGELRIEEAIGRKRSARTEISRPRGGKVARADTSLPPFLLSKQISAPSYLPSFEK